MAALLCVGIIFSSGHFLCAAEGSTSECNLVPGFTLKDYRGKEHTFADFKKNKFVVGVFLGTECPLAKLYAPRLANLSEQFGAKGVGFVGFNANQQDSLTEIASYARRHGVEFPILKDLGNSFADQIGAERTPEVFVWDAAGTILYRGRIDDQFGVGYVRNEPTRHDLKIALEELLGGQDVSQPVTEAAGCIIGRIRKPDPTSPITYSNQIARIMQKRCVECHRPGEIAPFTLLAYDDVVGWAEMIAEVVQESRMPPWHADPAHGDFANDRRLTDKEKEQIFTWVRRGAPEGDPAKLPPPREFIAGSQLPQEADMELMMRKEPFVVKAAGEVAYQNFIVDPGFKEDKWISMAEAVPGTRSVVHHIVVFVVPPRNDAKRGFGQGLQFLTTYVPGYLSRPLPKGMAKWVQAGSKFMFQLHYTPTGTEQSDLSKLRLVFADPADVNRAVVSSAVQIRHEDLQIPANTEKHRSEAAGRVHFKDAQLLSLFPHMHVRGSSFRIEAKYPDGTQETLLNVPNYDFNWQTTYRLRKPKAVPQGTVLQIVGYHNNSMSNLANPDPSQNVEWGDQTWEEMLIALYEWSIPIPKDLAKK
jgi:peroxiredoxin/mono/diheme cytochrome c family protein